MDAIDIQISSHAGIAAWNAQRQSFEAELAFMAANPERIADALQAAPRETVGGEQLTWA